MDELDRQQEIENKIREKRVEHIPSPKKTETLWVDQNKVNEMLAIPEGKTVKSFEQPVWDNISRSWLFEYELADL